MKIGRHRHLVTSCAALSVLVFSHLCWAFPTTRATGTHRLVPSSYVTIRSPRRPSLWTTPTSPRQASMRDEEEQIMRSKELREDSNERGTTTTRATEPSYSLLDSSATTTSTAIVPPSSTSYQVPDDPVDRHVVMLMAVTFPWYLFTAYQMYTLPDNMDFFGLSHTVLTGLAAYVVLSQVFVYLFCLQLAKATTLAAAQRWVGIMTLLCIPADILGTLFEPTGSLGMIVFAFAMVTTAFGIFLAHYARKAAFREIPPAGAYYHHSNNNDDDTVLLQNREEVVEEEVGGEEGLAVPHIPHQHAGSVWEALMIYRPSSEQSSTQLALEFTRGFVSFTISVSALGTYFAEGQHEPNIWIVASLCSVLVHTTVECFLATTYPGIELEEFDSYLVAESILYAIHMLASSIVSHAEGFGDALVDQVLWAWLFGSATGKLIDRLGKLSSKVDWDAKLGLSKL